MPAKFLTEEEWEAIEPPFTHVTVDNADHRDVHRSMMKKWIASRCGGWVYYNEDKVFVFERNGDAMMFSIWVKSEPFAEDGTIAEDDLDG